ncbi:MAG: protein translocase subunit SecF [Bacillota bacterium]|nr:protein translocase subunit SecF [Bacillota bacterium]
MNILNYRRSAFIFASLMITLSIIVLLVPGLNLGVDFTGGTILERSVSQEPSTDSIRQVLDKAVPELDLSGAVVQILDNANQFMIRTRELDNADILKIDQAFDDNFGELVVLKTDVVGPTIGKELVQKALLSIAISALGILLYVTLRFEYRFATVSVICILHDLIIVLGLFALTGREVNSPFVAAVLTVLGYSINDTIVIFDRIRENLRFKKKESYADIVAKSIKQSISRTINTSITTLLVVAMLVIFGGSAIQDFAFALLIGIIFGTFSSLFLAGPLWLTWTERKK